MIFVAVFGHYDGKTGHDFVFLRHQVEQIGMSI